MPAATEPDTAPPPLTGRPATDEEVFLLDWGRETYKGTIPRLNDALGRVITLSTALLGGSIYFVKDDALPPFFRVMAMFCFLAALSAAFAGTLFRRETVRLRDPEAIRKFKDEVATHRDWWLQVACWAVWAGLWFATAGVVVKQAGLL